MRRTPLIIAASIVAALAGPAAAQSNCHAVGAGPNVGFGFHIGEPYTEEERANFAMMELRKRGVDADRVELWGGCYRAFVNDGNGSRMEYFNAQTLDPVQTFGGGKLTLSP